MRRLIAAAAAVALGMTVAAAAQPARISKPGEYAGYSEKIYDGYQRTSFYIPMRDGTKLAADLFRPTKNGVVATDKLPVVWMHTPYNRRTYRGGPAAENYPGYALRLVPYGYNVAVVDFRGLFASFGRNTGYNRGEWVDAARWDAYDVTEWFARQPYSNGRIGMWGCSATGGSQMQAATTAPPSLKAIIPMSAEWEAYAFAVAGGMARASGPTSVPPPGPNVNRDRAAAPVDGPDGEALLKAAIAEHANNFDNAGYAPFRDSVSPTLNVPWWVRSSPHEYADAIKRSGIGVYAVANWDEAGTRHGAAFTYRNLQPNSKLLIGPATHCDWTTVKNETGFEFVTEELRFYDYWLKGIDNGVMDEPGVTYFTYNAPSGKTWQTSPTWPLASERRTTFHLSGVTLDPTGAPRTADELSTPFGASPRVTSTEVAAEGGLVFTTARLASAVQVTGHPEVRLWIAANAPDVDVTAILEDVAPDGTAKTYSMLGMLRASRRALAPAPYENFGLPWHSHLERDARPLTPGEPAELRFEMLPMSYVFQAGHRIRLRLVFSDPEGSPQGKTVRVLQGPDRPSAVILPLVPA